MSRYAQHRYGWASWWTRASDGRKITVSIDTTCPLDLVSPVFLSIGRGAPVNLTDHEVTRLIDALWQAKRAAQTRDEATNLMLGGKRS